MTVKEIACRGNRVTLRISALAIASTHLPGYFATPWTLQHSTGRPDNLIAPMGQAFNCHLPKTALNQDMILIPGGTFRMGSDRHYPEEAPAQ